MFKSTGYSYEEGVDELRRMLTIDSLLNFKIKSRLVVPEEEVREQYNNNPQIEPAAYRIKKGFLSSNALSEPSECNTLTVFGELKPCLSKTI